MKILTIALVLNFSNWLLAGEGEADFEKVDLAYQAAEKALDDYCRSWAADYQPLTKAELDQMPEWKREAIEIFTIFWNPPELAKLASGEFSLSSAYVDLPYVVMQRGFNVARVKEGTIEEHLETRAPLLTDEDLNQLGKVTDLRPNFKPKLKAAVLKLSPGREKVLSRFLDAGKEGELGWVDRLEQNRRAGFLAPRFRVMSHHWATGWHLVSFPEVEKIVFDADYDTAFIDFRVGYRGGTAVFKKQDEVWKMTDSKATWIE